MAALRRRMIGLSGMSNPVYFRAISQEKSEAQAPVRSLSNLQSTNSFQQKLYE
jgi:hypothetical protein